MRATKKDLYLREVDFDNLIKSGKSTREIVDIVSEKYKLSKSTIRKHHAKYIKKMMAEQAEERSSVFNVIVARNEELYKKAMEEGKYKLALDANMSQAKMLGFLDKKEEKAVDKPKVLVVSERDDNVITMDKTGSDGN